MLVLYCLCLFCGQFVESKETLSDVGDLLIYISVTNLVINLVPMLIPIFRYLCGRVLKLYRKYQNWKA